jgi:hypothetical protein
LSARNLDAGEVDTAVRRHGGYRFERHVGRAVRATLRWLTRGRWPSAARQQYWLNMYSWHPGSAVGRHVDVTEARLQSGF